MNRRDAEARRPEEKEDEQSCLLLLPPRLRGSAVHFSHIPHAPPGSPQRPQAGVSVDAAPLLSPPTAIRLSERAVFGEPHSGHLIFESRSAVRTSWSNFALHLEQVYS